MKKAKLFEQLTSGKIRCLACQRYCQITDDQVGFCQTRINKKGGLFSLTYGILSGLQIDPIEKKPLYHFYPGSEALSFGSYGCNYRCKQCLNSYCSWGSPARDILQTLKARSEKKGTTTKNLKFVKPEEIVSLAINKGCAAVAFTYNEPSIWVEYVYDCAKLCRHKGLHTLFVTNGSWSEECLKFLSPVIEATNIDIKGFYPETYAKMGAFFGDLLKITELAVKKYKIFTELTTLVIPTINDSEKELEQIAQWIVVKLGPDVPWHLSRFDPDLAPDKEFRKLSDTPIKTLKKAYEIGKKAGLKHIYVWAPPKSFGEELFSIGNTYCPQCGKLVIRRNAWEPEIVGLDKNKCKFCGFKLNLRL
ncbi:MAG TPA: AmmeMemoRadiSam system radical SAM enzyme [Candidatus Bathyarchaeia archaeon]|nr:AmmeMemoRadiSam system radical SAM enzyme [Candidatus Bathyarchaeia archaeon]